MTSDVLGDSFILLLTIIFMTMWRCFNKRTDLLSPIFSTYSIGEQIRKWNNLGGLDIVFIMQRAKDLLVNKSRKMDFA